MKFSVKNLNIGYNKDLLIRDFSAEFVSGNFIGLLGRNGSGKSTFLKHLAGISRPLSGEILLESKSIYGFSSLELAKKICRSGNEKSDFLFFTVEEYVALGLHPHLHWTGKITSEDKTEIQQALKLLEIESLADRTLMTCSDGERQSAMLARALVQKTDLILLDEITAHLDFVNRHKTFSLLKKIADEKNKLIIMATHEIDLALRFCSKLLLLHQGFMEEISVTEDKEKISNAFEGYKF